MERADPKIMQAWFDKSGITIGNDLGIEQRVQTIYLFYTWRDIFETDLLRI